MCLEVMARSRTGILQTSILRYIVVWPVLHVTEAVSKPAQLHNLEGIVYQHTELAIEANMCSHVCVQAHACLQSVFRHSLCQVHPEGSNVHCLSAPGCKL